MTRPCPARVLSPTCREYTNTSLSSDVEEAGRGCPYEFGACHGGIVDEDLEAMTRKQLIGEARRLRAGIRAHRDSTGHGLCWHHPALWELLPEKTDPLPTVPSWPEFLLGCVHYRQSLGEQLPDAPRSGVPYQP